MSEKQRISTPNEGKIKENLFYKSIRQWAKDNGRKNDEILQTSMMQVAKIYNANLAETEAQS